MIKESFNKSMIDYGFGYVAGGMDINKTFASYVSQSLRDGNGKPMGIYNKNRHELNDIEITLKLEKEESLKHEQYLSNNDFENMA